MVLLCMLSVWAGVYAYSFWKSEPFMAGMHATTCLYMFTLLGAASYSS